MVDLATWICWGAVLGTWIAGAVYAARASHGRREGPGGSLWAIGAFVGAVLVFRFARPDLHSFTDHSRWIELPGLVLLVVSTVFTIWARVALGRMWSASPNVLRDDHELRTDGPYAVTRHPIYSGLLGMLLGTVLLHGVGVSLGLLLVGAVLLGIRIPIEERLMSKTFPDQYARYREHVPRLVPSVHRLRRSH